MWAAIAAGIAATAQGVGSWWQNQQQKAAAAQQASDQANSSSTAYQRATADMQAAGLNPMLAYRNGGASTITGAQANIQNPVSNAVNSAVSAYQAQADVEKTKADTTKSLADAAVSTAMVPKVNADARSSLATAAQTEYDVNQILPGKSKLQTQDIGLKGNELDRSNLRLNVETSTPGQPSGSQDTQLGRATSAGLRQQYTESMLKDFQVPGARNQAAVDNSAYGRNVRPYVSDVGSLTSSAAHVGRVYQNFMH